MYVGITKQQKVGNKGGDDRGLYTELFYAIISTLISHFLLFCYANALIFFFYFWQFKLLW